MLIRCLEIKIKPGLCINKGWLLESTEALLLIALEDEEEEEAPTVAMRETEKAYKYESYVR